MVSNKPLWIPCCAGGTQPMAECCLQVKAGLVELLGHPQMQFTPDSAYILGVALIHAAQATGYETKEIN